MRMLQNESKGTIHKDKQMVALSTVCFGWEIHTSQLWCAVVTWSCRVRHA